MVNHVMPFIYEGSQVRTITIEGEPWFVAKDVCDIFGETNRNRAMQALDEDEKGYTQMTTPGGTQQLAVVNEAGLYAMLFAMQPGKARGVSEEYIADREQKLRSFKRWVTHEVLPQIRKTGSYSIQPMTELQILRGAIDQIEVTQRMALEAKEAATQANQQIQAVKDAIIQTDRDWRRWVNKQLQRIGFKLGDYQGIKHESYDLLERRGRCNLERRLENLKSRMKDAGATRTQVANANYLDLIEAEPRLKEIYTAIVKELGIKYIA